MLRAPRANNALLQRNKLLGGRARAISVAREGGLVNFIRQRARGLEQLVDLARDLAFKFLHADFEQLFIGIHGRSID